MKFACLLLSTMALSAAFSAPAAAAEQLDDKPRIAVMSAFEPEWKTLLTQVSDAQEHVLNGRRFVTGSMAGKDVVLFLSGVSMVNAAMTAQLALDRFMFRVARADARRVQAFRVTVLPPDAQDDT